MNKLRATFLAALLAAAASTTGADQTDSRLGALFAELQQAEGYPQAQPAESEIWRIWIEHPDRAVTLLMRKGMEAMGRGDRRGALEDFDQIVKIAPGFAEGWNKRATVHYMLGNHVASLADIEKTLELEPRHFGALSGRGLVYSALEEPELALESFEAALAVHPQMPGARLNAEAIRKMLKAREI